jgi:protein-tyrosine phosphatase
MLKCYNKITDQIYLGNYTAAEDRALLHNLGITHIINVTPELPLFPGEFIYLCIPVIDLEETDISKYFRVAKQFISQELSKKIFVHCMAGMSRSPTIVLSYLIGTGMSFQSAYKFVKERHPITDINPGFLEQLMCHAL